jgi:hypothetical protein
MFGLDTEQELYCNFKLNLNLEVQGKTQAIVGAAVTPLPLGLNLTVEADIF